MQRTVSLIAISILTSCLAASTCGLSRGVNANSTGGRAVSSIPSQIIYIGLTAGHQSILIRQPSAKTVKTIYVSPEEYELDFAPSSDGKKLLVIEWREAPLYEGRVIVIDLPDKKKRVVVESNFNPAIPTWISKTQFGVLLDRRTAALVSVDSKPGKAIATLQSHRVNVKFETLRYDANALREYSRALGLGERLRKVERAFESSDQVLGLLHWERSRQASRVRFGGRIRHDESEISRLIFRSMGILQYPGSRLSIPGRRDPIVANAPAISLDGTGKMAFSGPISPGSSSPFEVGVFEFASNRTVGRYDTGDRIATQIHWVPGNQGFIYTILGADLSSSEIFWFDRHTSQVVTIGSGENGYAL